MPPVQRRSLLAGATAALWGRPARAQNDALVTRAKAEGGLLWYTADTPISADDLAQGFRSEYGVSVDVSRKESLGLAQQFRTESTRGSSPADVVTVLGAGPIYGLKAANLLAHFKPAGAASLQDRYRLEDVAYDYALAPMGIAYNTNLVSNEDIERLRKYDGWLDPRFAGKMAIVGPFGGTVSANMLMLQEKLGIGFLKALAEKQKVTVYQEVAIAGDGIISGEHAICLNVTPSLVSRAAAGAPIRYMNQDDWTLVVPTVAAISEKAPHPNAARLFLEWLMTPQVQKRHAETSYWVPTLADVRPDYPKAAWLAPPHNPILPDDQEGFDKKIASSMSQWRDIFGW